MLRVGNDVANHIFQKDLEDSTCFLINEAVDSLDAAPTSQSSNCRLRNALNVISKNLPMPLRSSLSQPLASHPTPRHFHSLSSFI
ncbi:hypothetical protein V6N13_024719 [Hibiscus sabdariffa]|uniref:Uncharacterized protein n=1 Tax=Hibiscus sabdariffa TaxID=183260 RepID=A0ABR2QGQ9_9ROSI